MRMSERLGRSVLGARLKAIGNRGGGARLQELTTK